ncbi:MAG: division/cell wall cluster transcriptional repressor MraZ [Flavobacteriaceae bacterium]|nr:division/cell wall cluster transcriptional repressor MraZ [Flavobacteriaceae bacterium]
MISLIGTYECKIDIKSRIMLPVNLKRQFGDYINQSFIVKRSVFQDCLELHPFSEWKLTMKKINKLNKFVKKNNDFIRRYNAGVRIIEFDNNGRLLIPKELSKQYFSSNELVLTSAINIIEIWDKSKYEKVINDSEIDFAQLSESVMGNLSNDVS